MSKDNKYIENLKEEIEIKNSIIEKLRNELILKENETYFYKQSFKVIKDSEVWKLTKPLRKILDTFKNITSIGKKASISDFYKIYVQNEEKSSFICDLDYNPLFSVVVPILNGNNGLLYKTIDSIKNQKYNNYQIILVGHFERKDIEERYEEIKNKIVLANVNSSSISTLINTGIKKSNGEFVCVVNCGDMLSDNALYEVVLSLNKKDDIDLFYSNECIISKDGDIENIIFKFYWSPDTLLIYNYVGHFVAYRKQLMNVVGDFNKEYDGVHDYDYILRFSERTTPSKIKYIDKILYQHSVINDDYNRVNDKINHIKQDIINRREINAYLEYNNQTKQKEIIYKHSNELVSIIIPSKDNFDLLKQCIDSIIKITSYKNYEIIVVDNGSNDKNKKQIEEYLLGKAKYIYDSFDFNFSKMCNIGVKNAKGDYIVLLNDDIEIIQSDWLDKMVGQASQKHAGAVGCKLLYPNSNIIQHCGVTTCFEGPIHYYAKENDDIELYGLRNKINYNVISVTGACLAIRKKLYEDIGGFDEDFENNFNDVNFCFDIYKNGFYNIVLNDVRMYHHESYTRSSLNENTTIYKNLSVLKEKNSKYIGYDPFYNTNIFIFNKIKENLDDYINNN